MPSPNEPVEDSEHLPDQETLSSFLAAFAAVPRRQKFAPIPGMNLSGSKAIELDYARRQRRAVLRFIKEDLSRKLYYFFVLYYVVVFSASVAMALRMRWLPGGGDRDRLVVFFVANSAYFSFFMLLAFIYELYLQTKWYAALTALALVLLAPALQPAITLPRSLPAAVLVAVLIVLLLGVGFVTRTPAGARFRSWLKNIRRVNQQKNEKRSEFERTVRGYLLRSGRSSSLLRLPALRSAVAVACSIHDSHECENKREALEDFVKRHRFNDAMGRLATVVWVAGALGYLVFPLVEAAEVASLAAVNVLPIYVFALFSIERFDDAREEVFAELLEIIEPTSDG